MQVYASIQAEKSGRVYVIFQDNLVYHWVRATPGMITQGPFSDLSSIFKSMSRLEGKSAEHWTKVFSTFYPDMPLSQQRILQA